MKVMQEQSRNVAVEAYRDSLVALGAHKVAHQDETLISHMEHTCSILERMKSPPHVCLSGLFHGVYGTQALHSENVEALPEGRREQVAAMIGPRSERLVYNFSVMNYESVGRSLRNVLRGGDPDVRDRRTGEPIEMTHEEFDELLRLKLGDVLAHVPVQMAHSQLDLPAEYGSFWQIVAEHLGPDCVETWNSIVGGQLWIATNPN